MPEILDEKKCNPILLCCSSLAFGYVHTGSEIPQDTPVVTALINDIHISDEKMLKIIQSLNPNKAHGCEEISARMIKLSDVALVLPLKIIFTTV